MIFKFCRNSAVCLPPQSQSPRCVSQQRDKLHNAESISPVCITMKRQAAHRRVNLPGVYHNEETNCTSQSKSPWCLSQRRDKLHTKESISPVCITTKRQTAQSRVNLPGVYHNEATNCTPQSQSPRCVSQQRDKLHTAESISRCVSQRRDKLHTAESNSPVCITTKRQTAQRRVNLPGVYNNKERNCTPQSQSPQCVSQRRDKLRTKESKSKSLLVSGCL